MVLTRLVDQGRLIRRARGIYEAPSPTKLSDHESLREVALRAPAGTFCLLTALRLHELTTQNPFQVWLMIDKKARKPSFKYPPLRIIRASGNALTSGVETRDLDGVEARVTSIAKTVADCFKYRRLVGADVAREALRDAWERRLITAEEIERTARIDRVWKLVRPMLEVL